jgi:2,3-bisphosphoglycerate-independent phosphoglycerate mutase
LKKGEMNKVENVQKSFQRAKEGNGRLHLLGLISDGGVVSLLVSFSLAPNKLSLRKQHSKNKHLYGLLEVAKEIGVPNVFIHFFGDGRDTDPKSGAGYMQQLIDKMKELGIGQVATAVGRYYAMDRDKRWDRIEIALKGLVNGEGEDTTDPVKTIQERYEKGENDEFLKPIIIGGSETRIKGRYTMN